MKNTIARASLIIASPVCVVASIILYANKDAAMFFSCMGVVFLLVGLYWLGKDKPYSVSTGDTVADSRSNF